MPVNNLKFKTQKSKVKITTKKSKVEEKVVKKAVVKKTVESKLSIPVFNLTGKEDGTLSLPEALFRAKINKPLLHQAIRVYMNNNTGHFGNTKTRGEVKGSTRKIRAQKGTGGARHGSVRAPIFVGGGISFGPKSRKVELGLPQKMKKAVLVSGLSEKAKDNQIVGVTGLEKLTGKTKEIAMFLEKNSLQNALFIITDKNEKLQRAVKNLKTASFVQAAQLNILELIKFKTIIITEAAVKKLEERVLKIKE